MPTNPLPADSSWVTESSDHPKVPAEVVFLMVVLMLTVIFSIAGIPGEADPVATEGSDALRQGWLEQHNRTHAAATPVDGSTVPADPTQAPVPGKPAGR